MTTGSAPAPRASTHRPTTAQLVRRDHSVPDHARTAFNANGFLTSGGDPVIAYDRAGTAYYAQIAFNRYNDTGGVFVQRSTNGGFTWSRACVPINGTSTTDDVASCGSLGDPRQPGDGTVSYHRHRQLANGNVPFNDKEWLTAGPRPAGVTPQCFAPETRRPGACDPR